MKRFVAILTIAAVANAQGYCASWCRDPLIQDPNDRENRRCACKCKYNYPGGFEDRRGGKSEDCDAAINIKFGGDTVDTCECRPKPCIPGPEKCVINPEISTVNDFTLTLYGDYNTGCECQPVFKTKPICGPPRNTK